jgi:MOSC domain-containing protein YiiM
VDEHVRKIAAGIGPRDALAKRVEGRPGGREYVAAGGYLFAKSAAARENRAVQHLSRDRLMAGLGHIRDSPQDHGGLLLVVRRPSQGEREVLAEAMLDLATGVVGDNWLARGSTSAPDGLAVLEKQVTVMNARVAELVAGGRYRMPLAGDQLYVDLDLSVGNLPAGSLLMVGAAVLQVSAAPHLGCAKFVERFGPEAMRFVNSRLGHQLRLRGMNTRVVVPGPVRVGDLAAKAPTDLALRHATDNRMGQLR